MEKSLFFCLEVMIRNDLKLSLRAGTIFHSSVLPLSLGQCLMVGT